MAKTISKTSDEIRAKWTPDELDKLARKNIRSFSAGITKEDERTGRVKNIGRGFAVLKQYINRNGRPKVEDPKVSISIRIPLSKAACLRETGPGWQTRTSEFVVEGINQGKLTPRELPQKRK
jgi:uncharacterized protein (DUF4415 family)